MLKYMNGTADIGKISIPNPFQQLQQTATDIYNSVVPANIQEQIQSITPNTVNINAVLAGKVFLAALRVNFMGLATKTQYLIAKSPNEVFSFWSRYGTQKNLTDAVNAGVSKKAFGYAVGDRIGKDCYCRSGVWAPYCCKGYSLKSMGEDTGEGSGTDWAQYAKVALPIIQWIVSLFNKKKGEEPTASETQTLKVLSAALATYAAGAKNGTSTPYTEAPDRPLPTGTSSQEEQSGGFFSKPLNLVLLAGGAFAAYKLIKK